MVSAAMKLKDYLSYCSHFLKGNFLTIYVYQIITFYPLTLHNMVCQSYPNKAEKIFWELAEFQMNNIILLKIMGEEIWEPSVENTWDVVQQSQKFITLTVNYYICHHLLYLWQIHFDIWQNQYNIVKLNKMKVSGKPVSSKGW